MKAIPLILQLALTLTSLARVTFAQKAAPALEFRVSPIKQTFGGGEDIVVRFSLYNSSKDSVFVSRKMYDEFVDLKIFGPDRTEVPWRGKRKIDSKNYSARDFAVLKEGESIHADSIVSLKSGFGFVVDKPGRYRIRAEYSLGPPAYFAPFAGTAKVPQGTFRAKSESFCLERC